MSSKLTKFLMAFAALVMTWVVIYAIWIEPYEVDFNKHNFNDRGQKSSVTLVQLSDLHLQRFGEHEQALATKVRTLGADVIVISGDAIDRIEALPALRNFVDALGGAPVLLIQGNWEHWSQVNFDQLSSSGVKLLLNEQWTLKTNDLQIEIVGMDDFTAGKADLQLLTKREISESAPRGSWFNTRLVFSITSLRSNRCLRKLLISVFQVIHMVDRLRSLAGHR